MKFIYIVVLFMCVCYMNYICYKKNMNNSNADLKIHIFHMPNCHHCYKLMYATDNPPFKQLKDIFKTNKNVLIKDFLYGRDEEAKKYTAFPVIVFITNKGEKEYEGPHDAQKIADEAKLLL